MDNQVDSNTITNPGILWQGSCEGYLLFHFETYLGCGLRAFLYFLGLAYCFIGLSSITSRFFRSMENVVKQTREVVEKDPYTNIKIIRHEKVWNFAIADITLLAFGTSFPQISLATIDAIRNIGQLYAGGLYGAFYQFFFSLKEGIFVSHLYPNWSLVKGLAVFPIIYLFHFSLDEGGGLMCFLYVWMYFIYHLIEIISLHALFFSTYLTGLGPGTLVGSAAFDLFPIHAICVIVPKAGTMKKISDIGVWLVELVWSFWAYAWLYIILKVWNIQIMRTFWRAAELPDREWFVHL